jgi:signal transduction histidine kinase
LEGGVCQVFQTIPASLVHAVEVSGKTKIPSGIARHIGIGSIPASLVHAVEVSGKTKIPSGIARHMVRVNKGIAVLALQNRFINHLLSQETPPLILWQEDNGQILFANRGLKELWKQYMGSVVPLPSLMDFLEMLDDQDNRKECEERIPQDDQPQSVGKKRRFDRDRTADINFPQRGRSCYFRVVIHQVEDSILGFSGVLASFTNVTELRELEKAKGEMMSIVSHELRLPLTTILGYGEMLARSGEGEERRYAEKICDQAKRLAKMIDDFLDIARLESGAGLFKVYPYDFLPLIHDALSAVQYSAASKGIRIDLELPAKVTHLLGDEGLMTQAVLNILDNAIKFSPEQGRIRIRLIEKDNELELRVADQGSGISDEEKKVIFGKFVRGKKQCGGAGFGLGLNFVLQVVEAHHGRVEVRDGDLGGAELVMNLGKG